MSDPEPFDDPGPLVPQPPSRARRVATVAVLGLLIVSMVFLAFVSGRGLLTVTPAGTDRPEGSVELPVARLAVVDATGQLSTTDPTGTAVQLGDAGVSYSFPTWSPSGDRVAVIGTDGAASNVYVVAVPRTTNTEGPRPVYTSAEHPPFYISWSPDGRQIGFLTTEGDSLALRVAPADGSAPGGIVREGAPMYWDWTAPAAMLVHSGDETPDAFIGEVDLAGAELQPAVAGSGGFRAPAVSADGAFRAFVGPGEGTSDQVVIEPRTGTGRQVADIHGAAAIGFSPSTSDLAFVAPDAPGREIALPVGPLRLMAAPTGDVRVILTGPVVAFFWSPDGRTIAALQLVLGQDDPVARAGPAGRAVLARARTAAEVPGLAVRLVFVDPATGTTRAQREITVGDVFAAQVLPFFDQYALSHRIWSPDSLSVALPVVNTDGTTAITLIRADDAAAARIADGVAAAWSP